MASYLRFEERDLAKFGFKGHRDQPATAVLSRSQGTVLGILTYHAPWRQWVFNPNVEDEVIWSHDCLTDVAAKLRELNAGVGRSAGAGSQAR